MNHNRDLLVNLMQPLPAVMSDNESDSSNSSDESSDSEMDLPSDDEFEDPLDAADIHQGGPAEDDVLFPLIQFLMRGRRRVHVDDYVNTVRQKSNEEFRRSFRLTRGLCYRLIDDLGNSGFIPDHNTGKAKMSAEVSFLMFLWYVANEEPLRILSEIFDMSESSVFRIIRRVVDWLITLLPNTICWPRGDDIVRTANGFARPRGIEKCIGALDGCHIPIIKPSLPNAHEYFNRKKYPSINLTAIVNSERKFTMVYCGDPGSFHDTRVFRRSSFYQSALQRPQEIFPNNTFIIGDGGYQGVNDDWLVHPYRDNGHLTEDQRDFNRRISSTRVFVEQAFGILKGRFRRLLNRVHLFDIPFAVDLVVACCILHNLCIDDGDVGDDVFEPLWNVREPENIALNYAGVRVAVSRREKLFRQHFGYFNDGWLDGGEEGHGDDGPGDPDDLEDPDDHPDDPGIPDNPQQRNQV